MSIPWYVQQRAENLYYGMMLNTNENTGKYDAVIDLCLRDAEGKEETVLLSAICECAKADDNQTLLRYIEQATSTREAIC